jgi:2-keto-4-pentenoate hydratase/2-oxohepta-3-ene-1,7-dioic acid hydratase in catechol pathway
LKKYIKIYDSEELFEVHNIFCVGQNYTEHIKEFNSTCIPEKPVIFSKPDTAVISGGETISIPSVNGEKISDCLHYETEMVVAIGKDGYNIPEENAKDYIFGYAVGLDMTLRDVQSELKKKGLPWTVAKGFITSAPVSKILPSENMHNPMNTDIELYLNNSRIQFSNTSLMIFNIYKLIAYISSIFSISKGDLIFTGTPEGVGKVIKGDLLKAKLGSYIELQAGVDG